MFRKIVEWMGGSPATEASLSALEKWRPCGVFDVTEPVVSADGISKHYVPGNTTVRAVSDISLSIRSGEFAAIVGRSGSGKSTLMHLLGLLERPDCGRYVLKGEDVVNLCR